MMRIGHGYDVHRLVTGRKLILGGVDIPHETGLLGHSDADVLTHAVMDALLGAAAMGDIGHLFPDNDPAYAGADSLALLREVTARLHATGYTVSNLDCTVLAQTPKLAPHIAQMRRNLAQCMDVDVRFHLTLPASASRRRPRRASASPARARASPRTRSS